MKTRTLIIPVIAALAVTTSTVSAFSGTLHNTQIESLDLTDVQKAALVEAHELRLDGADREEVHAVLADAGITLEDMREMHESMREVGQAHRAEVRAAIEAHDYDAYRTAVAGTPAADIITSQEKFDRLVAAHTLRLDGDHETADKIMEELGFENGGRIGEGRGERLGEGGHMGSRGEQGVNERQGEKLRDGSGIGSQHSNRAR